MVQLSPTFQCLIQYNLITSLPHRRPPHPHPLPGLQPYPSVGCISAERLQRGGVPADGGSLLTQQLAPSSWLQPLLLLSSCAPPALLLLSLSQAASEKDRHKNPCMRLAEMCPFVQRAQLHAAPVSQYACVAPQTNVLLPSGTEPADNAVRHRQTRPAGHALLESPPPPGAVPEHWFRIKISDGSSATSTSPRYTCL